MTPPGTGDRPSAGGAGVTPPGSRPLAVVLAGGRSRRMGRPKATVDLGGRPLLAWPLAAARAAGLEAVVVAKPGSDLPAVDVPVWLEPETPSHPLAGLVAALERAAPRPVLALACDMPFVSPDTLSRLAELDATAAAVRGGPFPGRYSAEALDALRDGLRREASVKSVLEVLEPVLIEADVAELAGINDPEELARAEARLR